MLMELSSTARIVPFPSMMKVTRSKVGRCAKVGQNQFAKGGSQWSQEKHQRTVKRHGTTTILAYPPLTYEALDPTRQCRPP